MSVSIEYSISRLEREREREIGYSKRGEMDTGRASEREMEIHVY